MKSALRAVQAEAGAVFPDGDRAIAPRHYGTDDAAARQAVQTSAALADLSDWGRLRVGGADRLQFLHNQTTQDLKGLQPGQGAIAAVVNPTARPLDLVTVCATEAAVLLLTSPAMDGPLLTWFDRFIFPMDRVEIANVTAGSAVLSVVGPEAAALLERAGAQVAGLEPYGHQLATIGGVPVRAIAGSGLARPGFMLWIDGENDDAIAGAATVWQTLQTLGATPMGSALWDRLQVEDGRPVPGRELTEEFNALEAGLWDAVSFDKGCYIGQETIARLDAYDGVKQCLYGFRFDGPVTAGTPLWLGEDRAGKLTSVLPTEDGAIALGYLRRKAGGVGTVVTAAAAADAAGPEGTAVALEFVGYGRTG